MMSFGNELMLIDATARINLPRCSFLLMDFLQKDRLKRQMTFGHQFKDRAGPTSQIKTKCKLEY
jgi:hypothetical protein